MVLFRFSIYRSQMSRRRPFSATGPALAKSRYERASTSNFGQLGRVESLGSPVLAKFVHYSCICSEIFRSVASYVVGFGARSRVPKTYANSEP